jgi:glutathione S-transferase
MKLYYSPGACSLAVHITLEWIGEPYETQRVKLGDPQYLKINPAGAVPTLDTGEGWTLTQAGAVLLYLARRFPQADLGGGETLREQAELERWSHYFTGDLHPAFFPLFMPERYTVSKDPAALRDVREAALLQIRKRYALLEAHMAGREFVVGSKRSIVDAYSYPLVRWGAAKLPDGLAAYPNVAAHHRRLSEDEAVRLVLADEG